MNILGNEMGEREGNVGVRGVGLVYFLVVGVKLVELGVGFLFVFLLVTMVGYFLLFFSPSPVLSALSLLLLRFVIVSIYSCFSSGIYYCFFLFAKMGDFIPLFVSTGDFVDTVTSIVLAGVITVVVVVLVVGKLLVLFGEFRGGNFPHPFLGYLDPPLLIFFVLGVLVIFNCWCGGCFCRCHCLRAGSGKIIDWSLYFIMWGMLLNPPLSRHMIKA